MNHLDLVKLIWKDHLKPGDTVIDATAGNGHDALFLAELILTETSGQLHCIDIQEKALTATEKRLSTHLPFNLMKRVFLYHQSHEFLPEIATCPSLIVFNLGYLPGGDKTITTKSSSTLVSLKYAMKLLSPGGLITIVIYPGHKEGSLESSEILHWCNDLNNSQYRATLHQSMICNQSPKVLILEKRCTKSLTPLKEKNHGC